MNYLKCLNQNFKGINIVYSGLFYWFANLLTHPSKLYFLFIWFVLINLFLSNVSNTKTLNINV